MKNEECRMKMMTKRYYILMMAALLSLTASAAKWQGTIQLTVENNTLSEIRAVAIYDDVAKTITLGNGYNACISHFEEGILTIPGNSGDYKVVIGPMAFRFCNYLTEVRVEEGVETIGAYAFVGCSKLHTVKLPSTLTVIGSGAFSELSSLKQVYCNASVAPAWEWNDVFSALGTKASMATMAAQRFLYVPEASFDSYIAYKFDGTATYAKEKVGWADAFTRIYEMNDNPQTIGSLADLIAFRDAVNSGGRYNGSSSKSVTLTADIDMTSVSNWTPIGTVGKPFDGAFDGGGHSIRGLCVNNSGADYMGLFGFAKDATIYNLHLYNPTVKGYRFVAPLLGYAEQDVRISDVLVTASGSGDDYYTVSGEHDCGGIVGYASSRCSIERCMFSGVMKGALFSCGGILGYGYNDVTISDCSASHYIQTNGTAGSNLGGIVGVAARVTIERCLARNMMEANSSLGTKYGYVIGDVDNETPLERAISINNCAYWKYSSNINTVGSISIEDQLRLTQSGNKAFASSTGMMGEGTKTTLGDGWHYFTGLYTDYPIPATLLDMYLNHVVCGTTSDGLVFAPIGDLDSFTDYQVIGYTGTAKSVTIPAKFNSKPVTAIGNRAFYGSDIEEIDLGSVETIGKSAFEDCDALQTVSLPNSVTNVNARAFWNCDNLTSFSIGKKFQHHDGNFLAYCHKLQSLTVGPEGNSYGYLCQDNVLIHNYSSNRTSYIVACAPGKTGHFTIPSFDGYDYIHLLDNCFEGCTGLTSITFPSYVGCYLPNGVFNGLTNLHYIDMYLANTYNADHTQQVYYTVGRRYQDNPFYGTNKATIIYLKAGHESVPREYNLVIANKAYYLQLTDGWDFYPPTDITSDHGVHFDRTLQATRTEITQKTGNKITLKDENGQDVEVDELEVTGYTYTPRGYSVCLPYDLTLTAENAKVFVPSAITDGDDLRVTFTEVTDKKMVAYRPYYIVVSGEEEVNLSVSGRTYIGYALYSLSPQAVGSSDFEFKGTTTAISNAKLYDAAKPAYILQSDGNWHKVPANTEDAYVPPFRAYFQASNAKEANQLITMLNAIELSDVLDNSSMLTKYAGQSVSVTLRDRTLYKDGAWNTLCLPFSLTAEQVSSLLENPTGLKELQSSSFANGVLTLNFEDATGMEAGKPYLVKWDTGDDIANPTFTDVTINNTLETTTSTDYVDFVGNFSPVNFTANDKTMLYLGADNKLYYPSVGLTVNACRAVFQLKGITAGEPLNGVRSFVLNFGDEQTGIFSATLNDKGQMINENWYDLSGRRFKPQIKKGVYIKDGRKVIVK